MNYRFSVTINSESMNPTARFIATAALALATLPAIAQPAAPPHTFVIRGDQFLLDGKPFKVLSGELHYARIPREYWHARLKMARAMGLNTIATYVFWNVHEPSPGQYNFSGNADLVAFIKAAQEEGLYVILRAGPYSCAEWEFGGYPAWLLKDPRMATALRTNDPAFMVPVERWINRLAQETAPLQIGRGGPILITQVENEYGSWVEHDTAPPDPNHTYMTHMREIFVRAGFTASLLDTVDGGEELPFGGIPGVFTGVNFGVGSSKKEIPLLAAFQPGKPLLVTEYWPGWFDYWGHPHHTRPLQPQLDDLDYILSHGNGINLYMFHGGTSFGFMSGANLIDNKYLPQVTSYDYGAPLDEAGRPTPKFHDFRKIFAKYACSNNDAPVAKASNVDSAGSKKEVSSRPERSGVEGPAFAFATSAAKNRPNQPLEAEDSCLPPIPDLPPVITIAQITFTESTSRWDNLPGPIQSEDPHPMEYYDQAFGYILYRTTIPAREVGTFNFGKPHDYALAYLNGNRMATYDRRGKIASFGFDALLSDAPPGKTYQLDVLVANDSRVNFSAAMREENKGLVQPVIGHGYVKNWQVYTLPMTTLPTNFHPSVNTPPNAQLPPTFFRAKFTLAQTGDTFLDVRNLTKGALWINGHPIGRFWNVGPQQTLYVPGPWLRTGENEIIVFDLQPSADHPTVAGLDTPILDAPVAETAPLNPPE
jgi:beta-galactosidase